MSGATHNTDSRSGSWRDIRQEVRSGAMSSKGKRRRVQGWFKLSLLFCGTALAAWGIYEAVYTWETDRTAVTAAVNSVPVRDVRVTTVAVSVDGDRLGGVLTKEWVREALRLPEVAGLMALDLDALRARLLAYGQVRGAELTREFPDVLAVSLQERTPILRVQARDEARDRTLSLLVADDGVVYPGQLYDEAVLERLPYLADARLVPAGDGFLPIEGMAEVADLLTTGRAQAPHLYATWRVVSLARLTAHDEIVVRTQGIAEVVFNRRKAFLPQIARLDYIVDQTARRPDPPLESVNLALGSSVPIALKSTPEELSKTSTTISNTKKINREL